MVTIESLAGEGQILNNSEKIAMQSVREKILERVFALRVSPASVD
jgi:hypothetical protein